MQSTEPTQLFYILYKQNVLLTNFEKKHRHANNNINLLLNHNGDLGINMWFEILHPLFTS